MTDERPKTWGECKARGLPNGCPFVSCVHNLALDVADSGSIKVYGVRSRWTLAQRRGAERRADTMADGVARYVERGYPTCSLQVSEQRSGVFQGQIGEAWRVTRQRVEQIEQRARAELRKSKELRAVWEDVAEEIAKRPGKDAFELEESPEMGTEKAVRESFGKLRVLQGGKSKDLRDGWLAEQNRIRAVRRKGGRDAR